MGRKQLAVTVFTEDTSLNKRVVTTIFGGVLVALSLCATAQTFQVPHTFTGGTPALANQVNENFDAIEARLPNTGRIFIPPKAISLGLGANDQVVAMAVGANDSFTAAVGRPTDYVPGVAPDITIQPLLTGCLNMDVRIGIESDYSNIGPNGVNLEVAPEQDFTMPVDVTTIEAPSFTRTGLGDVTYITINRVASQGGNPCAGAVSLHGILITYPR